MRFRLCRILVIALSLLTGDPARAEQKLPDELFVFAYCNQLSVAQGGSLQLHVNSNANEVKMSISRLGAPARQVLSEKSIPVQTYPIPDQAASHGCDWPAATTLAIPVSWRSGYYEIHLSARNDNSQAEETAFFVVRAADPGSQSRILLQLSTNTYNAYTNWGGHSLYSYHDRDGLQGHRVSFNRPQSSLFGRWESHFVNWAEANGYQLEYAANSDLEFLPDLLQHYDLVLSVGHDEYWSSPMRDNLEAFIKAGGNVAFFSGNTCCWQVRSEDQGRGLTCWKQSYNMDPLFRSDQEDLLSTLWSHHRVRRPENQLTGVGFLWGGYHLSHGQFMDGPGSYKVHRPRHWILQGTGLRAGDRFGANDSIVGYECDGCAMTWRDGLPYPTGEDGTPASFTILASCPARWAPGDCWWYERFPKDRVGAAVLGTYTQGGTVVTCGSTDWAHGLSGGDPQVQQITRNVLDTLGTRQRHEQSLVP